MFQLKKSQSNPLALFGMGLFSAARKAASSSTAKKMAMFVVIFMLAALDTWATSTGAGGFTRATTEISSYQTPVANLMKAIAAVIVLVGAFNVYFKMQNGDQDVKKTIMLFANKCKFLNTEMFENILYITEIQYFQRFLNKTGFHENLKVFQSA